MSDNSEQFNSLPIEQRRLLNALRIEDEIKFIELEKKRMLSDFRGAIKAHNDRIKRMKQFLRNG